MRSCMAAVINIRPGLPDRGWLHPKHVYMQALLRIVAIGLPPGTSCGHDLLRGGKWKSSGDPGGRFGL
jgi:hypothetical protein